MGSQGKFTDSLGKYVSTTCTSRHVRMRITTIVIYFAGHKFRGTPGYPGFPGSYKQALSPYKRKYDHISPVLRDLHKRLILLFKILLLTKNA